MFPRPTSTPTPTAPRLSSQHLPPQDMDQDLIDMNQVLGRPSSAGANSGAIVTFENLGLKEDLLKGIYQEKYTSPSDIQKRVLPLLLSSEKKNVIAQSQTGSGKTASFMLAILNRIDCSKKEAQAVVILPTRELARQVADVSTRFAQYLPGFVVTTCVPEEPLVLGAQLIVGTPGKLTENFQRRKINTSTVSILVLDEADHLLCSQGLGDTSQRLKQLVPKNVQLVLVSATWDKFVLDFADKFAPNAAKLTIPLEELTMTGVRHFYMDIPDMEMRCKALVALYSLLTIGQSLIFVNTRVDAAALAKMLTDQGHAVSYLSGELTPVQRDEILANFRLGRSKVLLTTNVLARGIDVRQINLVFNYDLPVDKEGRADFDSYLHRVGRTGRYNQQGIAVSFVHDTKSLDVMQSIQDHFQCDMLPVPFDDNDWEKTDDFLQKALKGLATESRSRHERM